MGNRLDTLLIKELIDSPETVNTNYSSEVIDNTFREAEFAIQIDYDNGSSVDMDIELQYSNDNVNFVTAATQNVTDPTGTHMFDVFGSGASYVRVAIIVNSGSIDLQSILYTAKRRH